MVLTLSSHSRSFATRERAREFLHGLQAQSGDVVTVDVAGVMASPSFLAELLQGLVGKGARVVLVGLDEFQTSTATRLLRQLNLSERVSIDPRIRA